MSAIRPGKKKAMLEEKLTQEVLQDILSYCPDIGSFVWKERPLKYFESVRIWRSWNSRYAGRDAGSISKNDRYRRVAVFDEHFLAHRLAYLYMEGSFPLHEIDHINGVRADNSWSNLRSASRTENGRNTKIRSTNSSGVSGVYWQEKRNKWAVQITAGNDKIIHIGRFYTFLDAVSARKSAEIKYGFHANHGRSA